MTSHPTGLRLHHLVILKEAMTEVRTKPSLLYSEVGSYTGTTGDQSPRPRSPCKAGEEREGQTLLSSWAGGPVSLRLRNPICEHAQK